MARDLEFWGITFMALCTGLAIFFTVLALIEVRGMEKILREQRARFDGTLRLLEYQERARQRRSNIRRASLVAAILVLFPG